LDCEKPEWFASTPSFTRWRSPTSSESSSATSTVRSSDEEKSDGSPPNTRLDTARAPADTARGSASTRTIPCGTASVGEPSRESTVYEARRSLIQVCRKREVTLASSAPPCESDEPPLCCVSSVPMRVRSCDDSVP